MPWVEHRGGTRRAGAWPDRERISLSRWDTFTLHGRTSAQTRPRFIPLARLVKTVAANAALKICPHCGEEHSDVVLRCATTDEILPLAGRLLADKFRLVKQLGRGGMATVWLARHILVERDVAIKIIRPELMPSEEIRARFRGEARAAGRIAHPNVCEILDFGVGPVGPYIVMERLHGANLGDVLRLLGRLTPGQLLGVIRPALGGIAAAHARGIIHRDLKPENIFLHRESSGRLVVKLTDFGVAKFTDGTGEVETAHGMVIGTPHYMAPEQITRAYVADARTDIWALGTIFFRALVGRDAFKGQTMAQTLIHVTQHDPPPLGDVPVALGRIVVRCLNKRPVQRFANVSNLLEALDATGIADEPLPDLDLAEVAATSERFSRTGVAAPTPVGIPAEGAGSVGDGYPPLPAMPTMHGRPSFVLRRRGEGFRPGKWVVVMAFFLAALLGMLWFRLAPPTPATAVAHPEDEAPSLSVDGMIAKDLEVIVDAEADEPVILEELPEGDGEATAEPLAAERPGVDSIPPPPSSIASALPVVVVPDQPTSDGELAPGVRWGRYLALPDLGPMSDHEGAREYCRTLGERAEHGISNWQLANPTVARGLAEQGGLQRARYWTSALWRGRAKVLAIPGAKMLSHNVKSRVARPLCVTKLEDRG